VVIKELLGTPIQLILEMSQYSDVLLIDAVYAGQEEGEILLFDINDMCNHMPFFYIHEMNLSEAIDSGREMGIVIPEHFLFAGIEVGGKNSEDKNENESEGNISLLLQEKLSTIYQTLQSIVTDFLNKTI